MSTKTEPPVPDMNSHPTQPKWYTHINRNIIDSNRKHGKNDAPIRYQKGKYGEPTYAHRVRLPAGATIIYDGSALLPCGARLIIESEEEPEVVS